MSLLERLKDKKQETRRAMLAEYQAILHREAEGRPGDKDAERLAELMDPDALGLDEATITAHLRAVAETLDLERDQAELAQREAEVEALRQQAIAGQSKLDAEMAKVKSKYEPALTALQTQIRAAKHEVDLVAGRVQAALAVRQRYPDLFSS